MLATAAEEQLNYYHAAFAWALAGEKTASLETLEKALEIGGSRQGGYRQAWECNTSMGMIAPFS